MIVSRKKSQIDGPISSLAQLNCEILREIIQSINSIDSNDAFGTKVQ